MTAAASPAPTQATRCARARWPAPIFVPTIVTRPSRSRRREDLQIFQACADPIARQSERAKGTDETGQKYHVQIGEHGVERTGQADTEDLPEERRCKRISESVSRTRLHPESR